MRTIDSYRAHAIEILHNCCRRPGMFGRDEHAVETLLLHFISELCWIDEQESTYKQRVQDLHTRGIFQSTRVAGRFKHAFPGIDCFTDEVASVYCQIAYQLGYIQLDHLLTEGEWRQLSDWFAHVPMQRNYRLHDITQHFGAPSFAIGGHWYQVHCYAGPDTDEGWLCFDYANEPRRWTDENGGHCDWVYGEDFILRNRRRTAGLFETMFEFTPFGQALLARYASN